MSLKNMGRERKSNIREIVKCPHCKKKNELQDLLDTDRVVKLAGCTIYTCIHCEEEFQG
jgi:DNA-directed RNA polymerase subunit RPC12/RpoP